MLATTSVAPARVIWGVGLEKIETNKVLENLVLLEKISHFLKERSQKRGEMCLFCAKKWLTLGCFTEKTYICSDK